ncbi:MAG TPA: DUF805 domain-containing protein [Tepidisphaeraceae bacterium]
MEVLKKYAVFEGRARRKEYWMFVLVNVIISLVLGIVGGLIHLPIIANIYNLAVLVPSIAVGVRRMHDTDHSGWWLLLPIVNLVFACTDSTPGPNRFGENPKGVPAVQGFPVIQQQ